MIKKRHLFGAFLFFILLILAIKPATASSILIFSTSHTNNQIVTNTNGILKLEISAFSTIESITVNNVSQTVSGDKFVQLDIPYNITEGVASFHFAVKSINEEKTLDFILRHEAKNGDKDNAFSAIALIGGEKENNAANVPSDQDETEGTKRSGIFIPFYELEVLDNSSIKFGGILSIENYDDDALDAYETQLYQLNTSWVQYLEDEAKWELGFSWTYIGTGYESPLKSTDHQETDRSVFGIFDFPFDSGYVLNTKLEITDKISGEEEDDENYNADATIVDGTIVLSTTFFDSLSSSFFIEGKSTDAVGIYIDEFMYKTGLALTYKISIIAFSFSGDYSYTELKEVDPQTDEQEKKTLSNGEFGLTISFTDNFLAKTFAKTEIQTSNVEDNEYENTSYGLSLIYVY